jgi:hypothetical protein
MMVAKPHRVWRVLVVSPLNCFCLKQDLPETRPSLTAGQGAGRWPRVRSSGFAYFPDAGVSFEEDLMSLREGAIRLVSRIRSLSRGKRLSKHLAFARVRSLFIK